MNWDNLKYKLLQATYWMHFSIGFGYVTYYLVANDFAAGEIGILTAAFGILAAFLQSFLGNMADRSIFWNWKRLLLAVLAGCLTDVILLSVISSKWAVGLLYGIYLMCISAMMGLVNSASFYYNRNGSTVNFGVARGIGSLSYAAMSFLLGQLTLRFGTIPVNVMAIADTIVMALVVCSMRTFPEEQREVVKKDEANKSGFFAKYPFFVLMVLGTVALLTFHNISITYLLQVLEKIGGNSETLGNVLAVSAVLELPILFGFTKLVKRWKPSKLLVICAVAFVLKGASYVIALHVGSVPMIYFAQIFQMFSFAIFASASVYYVEQVVESDDRMRGHAWMGNVPTIGSVVGNLCGGWLLDGIGAMGMLLTGVGIAIIGCFFVLGAHRMKVKK